MAAVLTYRRKLGAIVEAVRTVVAPYVSWGVADQVDLLSEVARLARSGEEVSASCQRRIVDECLAQARAGLSARKRVEAAGAIMALAQGMGKRSVRLESVSAKQVMKTYRTLTELPLSLIDREARETFDLSDDEIAVGLEGAPSERLALTVAVGLWRLSDARQSAGELLAETSDNLGGIWRKLTC